MTTKKGIAKVEKLEIAETLTDAMRVTFSFNAEKSTDENDVTNLLLSRIGSNSFNVIINAPASDFEILKSALVGKNTKATVFIFTVSELCEGTNIDAKSVLNADGSREYSSLNDAYIGDIEDWEASFKKTQRRFLSALEEGHLTLPKAENK